MSIQFFEGIEPLHRDPEPPRRKRRNARTAEVALVACREGCGVVLAHDGPGIEALIEEEGRRLDHLGLDDAPEGLSIWEGRRVVETSPADAFEQDDYLDGVFRALDDEEWKLFRETGEPWSYEGEGACEGASS